MTIWVVTIHTEDGVTCHVQCASAREASDLILAFCDDLGCAPSELDGVSVREQPATWACDGRDNCLAVA